MSEAKPGYIYTPEETERRRAAYIESEVYPYARKWMARLPELQTAVLFVAQYWSDEADDAVHGEVAFSTRSEPDIPAYLRALEAAEAADDYEDYEGWSNFMEGPEVAARVAEDLDDLWLSWDDNGGAIPLFAAFCKEDCHQEMPMSEAYAPVAIIRRGADGALRTEMIGQKLRPWLEGVKPEWWGEGDGDGEVAPPDEPEPTDEEARGAKGVLERLMKKWL